MGSDVMTYAAGPPHLRALSLSGIAAVVLAAVMSAGPTASAARGLAAALAPAPSAAVARSASTGRAAAPADPRRSARTRAMATGKAVPVDALTTVDSATVANPDGSFTLTTTAQPTRMRDASGAWEDIDATLRWNADGSVSTRATPDSLTLSGGGGGPVATLADGSGHTLALSLSVGLPRPALSGASATYRGVYRGVDLVVTARPSGGFGEVFVIHDAAAAAAASSLRFTTDLRGLALQEDGSGGLQAVDATTGQVVLAAPPAAMWDSSTTGGPRPGGPDAGMMPENAASSPSGPGPHASVAQVPVSVDGGGLTLEVGAAALSAPAFPLYVDPTWTPPTSSAGKSFYGEVKHGCPTDATYDSQAPVGYNDFTSCIGAMRTFFVFNISALNSNFKVLHSTLKISEVWSAWDSCGQSSQNVTVKWTNGTGSGLDWNNQPGVKSNIDTVSVKTDGNSAGKMCSGGTVPVDFNVASVINQVLTANTLTVGLYGNETAGSHSLERFNTNPAIDTQYDIPPNTPGSLAASPTPVDSAGAADQGCGSAAAGFLGISNLAGKHVATLSAKLTSSIAAAQMNGNYTIHDDTANKTVATPASNGFVTTGASVSVNTPTLTDGHQYSWSLYADDQFFDSPQSTACKFLVDQSAPFNPGVKSTDFPPAGSGTPSTKTNGQTGTLMLTSSDPNPNSGRGSGMKGFRWSLDSPIPSSGASTTASSGTLTVSITPAQWGTHTLYAEAVDNAGNVSGQSQYSFYVPWNPATRVAAGDVNGDGIPDVVTTTGDGNLVMYAGNADPAGAAVLLSTPQFSPDGQGTNWNHFLVTHRGSFSNQGVDDLWAYAKVTHGLYLYKNVGSIPPGGCSNNPSCPFENNGNVTFVTKSNVVTDANFISPVLPDGPSTACHTTSTGSCATYDNADWSTVTQFLGAGDLYAGTPVAANDNGVPGLLTVEGGSLWYYQGQTTQFYIGTAIQLGTSGWNNVTLIAPGTVNGKPTLWARDNSTGVVSQYTITFDANGDPVSLGTPSSGTPLTIPNGVAFTTALYPAIASPGDLRGSGNPDLVATTTAGHVIDYPGTAPTSAGLATFGSPDTLGAQSGIVHDWPLTDGSGTTAADTASGASATLSSGASWATDSARGTVVAVNGSSGYLTLPQQMISGTSTLTLAVTFKPNSGSTGIVASTGHDVPASLNSGAMPVMYIGTDGKLYAQFWNGAVAPMISPHAVNDGAWHTATLVGAATIQSLYLDGHFVGSQKGTLANVDPQDFAGAGVFNVHAWINSPGGNTTTHASYFSGDLSEILFSATAQAPATTQVGVLQPIMAAPMFDAATIARLGLTQDGLGEIDLTSDGTQYPDGSVWSGPKTTMSFDQGVLTLADSTSGQVIETYGISGYAGAYITLQTDGNFVIYDSSGNPLWAMQQENATYSSGDVLQLLANGNVDILGSTGALIWQGASRANPGNIVLVDETICVDDTNGTTTAGNKIQVWHCLGNPNQTWSLGSDGTIRYNANQSFCLEAAGSGTADGTLVDLGTCNGGANQQWSAQATGALVNANSGTCLDDPNDTTSNGTQLQISTCTGSPEQTWEIPGI
jgi:hypothetical protein